MTSLFYSLETKSYLKRKAEPEPKKEGAVDSADWDKNEHWDSHKHDSDSRDNRDDKRDFHPNLDKELSGNKKRGYCFQYVGKGS